MPIRLKDIEPLPNGENIFTRLAKLPIPQRLKEAFVLFTQGLSGQKGEIDIENPDAHDLPEDTGPSTPQRPSHHKFQ